MAGKKSKAAAAAKPAATDKPKRTRKSSAAAVQQTPGSSQVEHCDSVADVTMCISKFLTSPDVKADTTFTVEAFAKGDGTYQVTCSIHP